MNIIFLSVFLIEPAAGFGSVSMKQSFELDWDMENNCGAKPQGPQYPYPPATNGTYLDNGNCDVVEGELYIYNYACSTNCQMDTAIEVKLVCTCLKRVGPIEKPVQCEWEYLDDISCNNATEPVYDWECDPRQETCTEGQYPKPESDDPVNPFGMWWNSPYGNGTGMMQGGMPGYVNHIYISPNMVQNSPGGSSVDSYVDDANHTHTVTTHDHESDEELSAKLAEAREKSRGFKSVLKATISAFERERERYEEQLNEKDLGREELSKQVDVMRELLRYKITETNEDVIKRINTPSKTADAFKNHRQSESENVVNDYTSSRTLNLQIQNNTSDKEMLSDDPGTAFPLIQRRRSHRGQLIEDSSKEADERPLKSHREISDKLKKMRERVQKYKSARPHMKTTMTTPSLAI